MPLEGKVAKTNIYTPLFVGNQGGDFFQCSRFCIMFFCFFFTENVLTYDGIDGKIYANACIRRKYGSNT